MATAHSSEFALRQARKEALLGYFRHYLILVAQSLVMEFMEV